MSSTSRAYILIQKNNRKYTFDGVTAISLAMTLKVSTDTDPTENTDWVNNARNEPDVVTLSVTASDAHTGVKGWSAQMLRALAQIKEDRLLCRVVTPLRSNDNMLLTDLSVQQDDTCPDGWTGTLTFTHTNPPDPGKTDDNASTPSSSGVTSSGGNAGIQTSTFLVICYEAGIRN